MTRRVRTACGCTARAPSVSASSAWPRPREPVCAEAGWSLDDVTLLVPHQANLRIIEAVAKRLALPLDRVVINIDRYGNTSGASIPIALTEAVGDRPAARGRQGRLHRLWIRRRVGWHRSAMDRADAVTSRRQAPRNRLQAPGPELRPTAPTTGTVACPRCKRRFVAERYAADLNVCSECGHHGVVGAAQRIEQLADPNTAETLLIEVGDRDPLGFDDGVPYPQRVAQGARDEPACTRRFSPHGRRSPATRWCSPAWTSLFSAGRSAAAPARSSPAPARLAVEERRALVAVCTSGRREDAGGHRVACADGSLLVRGGRGRSPRGCRTSASSAIRASVASPHPSPCSRT